MITVKDGEITIKPAAQGAKTKVNGMPLPGERVLKHLDRVLFGEHKARFPLGEFVRATRSENMNSAT